MNKGREAFNKAINFLTGDNWDIHFIQADSYSYNPTKKVKEYDPQFFEKVALFSGGLDSLIGFIDEASTHHLLIKRYYLFHIWNWAKSIVIKKAF